MKVTFVRFLRCSHGATAIEYGLIAVLIAATLTASLTGAGRALAAAYDGVQAALASIEPAAGGGGRPPGKGSGKGDSGNGKGNGGPSG